MSKTIDDVLDKFAENYHGCEPARHYCDVHFFETTKQALYELFEAEAVIGVTDTARKVVELRTIAKRLGVNNADQ